MSNKFIVSIDEGTSSARAFVFDEEVNVKSFAQFEIGLSYPRPGYVEQDPEEIWNVQLKALKEATSKIDINKILGIGITNQRETTILWDDRTGKPVYNAIVWQDRRTADLSDQFKKTYLKLIREKTGLIPDPYFSATKIKWLLDNNPKIKEKAMKGEIKFGTVDTFLIWKLTDGKVHVTDYSNASRTMLFNINKLEWDMELLELFNIPEEILPEVRPSSEIYGYTNVLGREVPISSDIGDQQAALFGQVCFNKGETKATYGTGTFILMNTGNERKDVEGLLTTIAWNIRGSTSYALEGSVFTTGAALQWAKDNLGIAKNYEEMEKLASSVNNNELVYFVPALTGLGAPYWDPHARGIIIGITRNTTGAHILRALFESIAFQTKDIIDLMQSIVGKKVEELKVDGGSTKSNFLLQLLADILGIKILRPKNTETTSMGAAFLAGLTVDLWKLNDIKALWSVDTYFSPKIESEKREFLYNKWKEAVKRSMSWI